MNLVESLIKHYFERQELREKLKEVYDLERLAGRVAFGNVNARDLVQLKRSLKQIPLLNKLLAIEHVRGNKLAESIDPCEEVTDLLETSDCGESTDFDKRRKYDSGWLSMRNLTDTVMQVEMERHGLLTRKRGTGKNRD